MKTSELIAKLEASMEANGDIEVGMWEDGYSQEILSADLRVRWCNSHTLRWSEHWNRDPEFVPEIGVHKPWLILNADSSDVHSFGEEPGRWLTEQVLD